jgi:hypothetical protein
MSKAPCGHLDAECVIGNFWTCKSCGGESKAAVAPGQGKAEDYLRAQQTWTVADTYAATPHRYTREYIGMWTPPIPSAGEIASILKVCAAEINYPTEVGAWGACTNFLDPITEERALVYSNKLSRPLTFPDGMSGPEVLMAINHAGLKLVEAVNQTVRAVVDSRGWPDGRLLTLGDDVLHVVPSDGNIATRMETSLEYEIRLRAIFRVVPG